MAPNRSPAAKNTEEAGLTPKSVKSSDKRKASSQEDNDPSPGPSQRKKAKASEDEATEGQSTNGQPTNKVLPVTIQFAPKHEGTLRIATWNICGLAAASKKASQAHLPELHSDVAFQGFKYYVEAEDADILVLTETKVGSIICVVSHC